MGNSPSTPPPPRTPEEEVQAEEAARVYSALGLRVPDRWDELHWKRISKGTTGYRYLCDVFMVREAQTEIRRHESYLEDIARHLRQADWLPLTRKELSQRNSVAWKGSSPRTPARRKGKARRR
jgi:hypothetical protein